MHKGINIYEEVRHYFGKKNETAMLENFSGAGKPPCIFLSHRSSDKDAVKATGAYIMNAGINIYMDINDPGLQAAVAADNSEAITLHIERGITASTDLMAFISKETFQSCWIPYEIGYGKKSEKFLSSLRLNDTPTVPSYLKISSVREIDGLEDLNSYLREVHKRGTRAQPATSLRRYHKLPNEDAEMDGVLTNFSGNHPLHDFLDK